MRMEREATSNGMDITQEIADATGWVRLANGEWKYYVVSYSFSTSNHNQDLRKLELSAVVSYSFSTSNHNVPMLLSV